MKGYAILFGLILVFSTRALGNAWVVRHSGAGDSYDYASALAVDNSGNVYVTGVSNDNYLTVKYDPNGNEICESMYNGPSEGYDAPYAMVLDDSGNVYVTGSSYDVNDLDDYLTVKYSGPNVVPLWTSRYDGTGNGFDAAYAITVSTAGNVYVTGSSSGNDANMSIDYATIKYNSSGVQQWASRYNNSDGWDAARAIAVDSSGNAYVTGTSTSSTTGTDITTIKYYNFSGGQIWIRHWPTSGNTYETAYRIVLDNSNNAYIIGASDSNYVTIKYNSSGTLQWSRIYDGYGEPNGYDCPYDIAVDSSGNVYVTGQSYNDTNDYDYATVKYNSSGTLQWEAFYDGPVSGPDYARSIAVDGSGNVYVTGESYSNDVIYFDYATVKYNSSGTQQWAARYNGPGHSDDYATDIVVDGPGNVYVTGSSTGAGTNLDFATIKNPNEVSYCTGPVVADLNNDCVVDLADFGNFASHWLESNLQ